MTYEMAYRLSTYLSRECACGHKGRSVRAEFRPHGRSSPWLIQLNGDVLPFNLSTMQSLFSVPCILFPPELDQAGVLSGRCGSTHRSERAIRSEQIVQLRVGEPGRKLFHKTR